MRDRISTKILGNGATRYGVYDEDGNLLRYEYIKLEDEPDEEGSLWNKANVLPDHIPALLGLEMSNPQVKDALNVLANIGNVHVWSRTITLTEATYKPVVGEDNYSVTLDRGDKLYYSDSVDIASLQDINLASPVSTFSFDGYSVPSVVGKYIRKNDGPTIYIYPASNQSIAGSTLWLRNCHEISAAVDTPVGTHTDFVTSTDSTAYPQDGDVGDYHYTYLGQLGDKARIEVGSYVGTGKYGSSNKNSLTFGFEPKLVILGPTKRTNSNAGYGLIPSSGSWGNGFVWFKGQEQALCSGGYAVHISQTGKTLSWYGSKNEQDQQNQSGYTYGYIAIG